MLGDDHQSIFIVIHIYRMFGFWFYGWIALVHHVLTCFNYGTYKWRCHWDMAGFIECCSFFSPYVYSGYHVDLMVTNGTFTVLNESLSVHHTAYPPMILPLTRLISGGYMVITTQNGWSINSSCTKPIWPHFWREMGDQALQKWPWG